MAIFTEFLGLKQQETAEHVSDLVPWSQLVAPGVLKNKDGSYQRTWRIRGQDSAGQTKEEQGAHMLQASDILQRLGGKWTLHSEAQRTRVTHYPSTDWQYAVAKHIDLDRARATLHDPGTRETRYYLTLTWQPPTTVARKLQALLVTNAPRAADDDTQEATTLDSFTIQTAYFMTLLQGILPVCEPCNTDDMLSYLSTTVSDRWHTLRWSGNALDIDTQLCDAGFVGGWYPQLGAWHLRTCSFISFPAMSHAGMARYLESLDLDYRWVVRWNGMEREAQASILKQTQFAWVHQQKGFLARLAESKSGQPTEIIDSDARNKAAETDAARQEVGARVVAYGDFTSTITVWDSEADKADEKLAAVRSAFEAQGFKLQPETVHGREAWLSSHPGNRQSSIRKTKHSTLFLSHMFPGLQATWMGPEREHASLNGPAWLYAHTDESTIFRLVNRVRDVGHFQYIGPTGSGKSTQLGLGIAQWYKFKNARARIFDVGRTARLITLLLGGTWVNLGAGNVQFQPFRHVENQRERTWLLNWLLSIVEQAGIEKSGLVQEYLSNRLTDLSQLPPNARTWSRLVSLCEEHTRKVETRVNAGTRDAQGLAHPNARIERRAELQHDIQRALRPFAIGGEYGFILDGIGEDIFTSHLVTFEQKELLRYPRLVEPVIQYCFHTIEQGFSTATPTLLVMEESALVAMLPLYREQFDAWLMTVRKEGVSVGFVINSLRQAADLRLGLLNDENCPTTIYFPNRKALTPQIAAVYEQFGLNEEERKIVATALPYRDAYYVSAELGRRLYHLPLSRFVLDCIARNDEADHELMDRLLEEYGHAGFRAAWLRYHSYEEEANDAEKEVRGRSAIDAEWATVGMSSL